MSYQVFKGDIVENKFIEAFKKILEQTNIDLRDFTDDAYTSYVLGGVLYDLKLIPVYNILDKSLMLKVWYKILEQFPNVGTINAYCQLIYAVFGDQAYIEVDNDNPLNLRLGVTANYQSLVFWTTKDTGELIVTQSGENIQFKSFLYSVSNRELFNLIYEMTNAGTNIDIEFKLNAVWKQPVMTTNGVLGQSDFAVLADPDSADAYKMFDNNSSTYYTAKTTEGSITIYSKNYISVNAIGITGGNIKTYKVYGSVNNQKWDLLKEGDNFSGTECAINMGGNSEYYKYYQIDWTGSNLMIYEIGLTALGGGSE